MSGFATATIRVCAEL